MPFSDTTQGNAWFARIADAVDHDFGGAWKLFSPSVRRAFIDHKIVEHLELELDDTSAYDLVDAIHEARYEVPKWLWDRHKLSIFGDG